MRDPSPIALRKLLALRQFPVFATAELGELAVVADNLVEVHHAAGSTVAAPATRLAALDLVLAGRIEMRLRGGDPSGTRLRSWVPRQAFGTLEVLSGRPLGSEAIAVEATRTLRLRGSDLRDILEDNFGLLAAVLRELAVRLAASGAGRPVAPAAAPPRVASLGLVERMIVLREQLPFLAKRLEPLAMLAHAVQELSWPAGATIARAADLAHDAYVVLDGALALTRDGEAAVIAAPGAAVGVLEILGSMRHPATIAATVPTRALRIPGAALFDALEEHTELAMSLIAVFAGLLLDASTAPLAFATREPTRSLEWPAIVPRSPGSVN